MASTSHRRHCPRARHWSRHNRRVHAAYTDVRARCCRSNSKRTPGHRRLHFLLPQLYRSVFRMLPRGQLDRLSALIGCHARRFTTRGRPTCSAARSLRPADRDGSVLRTHRHHRRERLPPRDIAPAAGAPLVPYVDWLLFAQEERARWSISRHRQRDAAGPQLPTVQFWLRYRPATC